MQDNFLERYLYSKLVFLKTVKCSFPMTIENLKINI